MAGSNALRDRSSLCKSVVPTLGILGCGKLHQSDRVVNQSEEVVMTRNVRTIAKTSETHPLPISILEALIAVAVYLVWLIVSLALH